MQFNIKEWRSFYDKTQSLGLALKNSLPTIDEDKGCFPPLNPLTMDEQKEIESKIKGLCEQCSRYMDMCGMYMPKALWNYDKNDPSTWISSPTFKYHYLLNNRSH